MFWIVERLMVPSVVIHIPCGSVHSVAPLLALAGWGVVALLIRNALQTGRMPWGALLLFGSGAVAFTTCAGY